MTSLTTKHCERRFNPWPYAILGFFGVAIVGAVIWVGFCISHGTDLVAADYYEQEVEYQTQLDRIERAENLFGDASVSYDARDNFIRIQLPREHVVPALRGVIHLYRPSRAELDQTRRLDVAATGEQRLDTRELLPGLWEVRVLWTFKGEEFFLTRKMNLQRQPL
jgi:hypothetical protein